MIRRARVLSVLAVLAAGAIGLIGSTQPWAVAALTEGELPSPGARSIPVLQPLMLAVLALGLVLTLAGRIVRYILGALAILIGAVTVWLAWPLTIAPPLSAVESVVTERTGLAGEAAIADVVTGVTATPWPIVTVVAAVVLILAGAAVVATAHAWARGGRRYDGAAARTAPASGPLDAVDSWDDLSRGDDPTR